MAENRAHRGGLDFQGERPFAYAGYIHLTGRNGSGTVSCRVSIRTLEQLSGRSGDPLEIFEKTRSKIESIFSKLHELGLSDEEGNITFSLSPDS
ncbi:MAG: DUF1488 family protein [Desulfovibrionales bacterium]